MNDMNTMNKWAVLYQNTKTARDRLIGHLRRDVKDERVLDAMAKVPREQFIPAESRHLAYEDIPLPIGQDQTISQPFIVALMTQALEITGTETVLELGTGSGYQCAILSLLAKKVFSVERHPLLAENAAKLLAHLGYTNIEVHMAENLLGWPAGAPYDAIIVTAGAPKIPQELINQLASGGRMVIPVGSRFEQDLLKITKSNDGFSIKSLGPCRFVPLVGKGAWSEETETWDA